MDIQGIPISSIWSFLRWLPKPILQKKFPPQRLAQLVYVDMRPRHESATVNLADSASFRLWIQLINLSPFEIEMDRSELFFWCGPRLKTGTVIRKRLKPGEIASICLEEVIPDGQANHIAQNVSNGSCNLDGHIEFNCALHNFSKKVSLDGINPRYLNTNVRAASA